MYKYSDVLNPKIHKSDKFKTYMLKFSFSFRK